MSLDIRDFAIPKDLERYRQALIKFAREELDPLADRIDRQDAVPKEVLPLLQRSGLLMLPYPKEYGGFGLTYGQWYPILEVVAGVGGPIRGYTHGGSAIWRVLYKYGTPEQKEKYLRPIASGKKVSGFAITEPDNGTGVDITTTATKRNGQYVINGRKHLISNSDTAFYFMVLTYTDRSKGAHGISCVLVDRETPGLKIGSMKQMMAFRGIEHGILEFKDCAVPQSHLVGKEGDGLAMCLDTFLTPSRWAIGICFLGLVQRLLDLSVEFAKKRVTFGKPIASRQAVQQMLADAAIQVYALRSMIEDTGRKMDQGLLCAMECAMVKGFGIEASRRVSDIALQIHGGIGLSRAFPVERLYRECRPLWFEEGTNTIQRLVIARTVLGAKERPQGG